MAVCLVVDRTNIRQFSSKSGSKYEVKCRFPLPVLNSRCEPDYMSCAASSFQPKTTATNCKDLYVQQFFFQTQNKSVFIQNFDTIIPQVYYTTENSMNCSVPNIIDALEKAEKYARADKIEVKRFCFKLLFFQPGSAA